MSWYKHSVLAVLDVDLNVLGWTWILNSPVMQARAMLALISRPFATDACFLPRAGAPRAWRATGRGGCVRPAAFETK